MSTIFDIIFASEVRIAVLTVHDSVKPIRHIKPIRYFHGGALAFPHADRSPATRERGARGRVSVSAGSSAIVVRAEEVLE